MRKPIAGYNRYEIDETGRVFNTITGKELKASKGNNGYMSIELVGDNGISKRLLVHRLVALAFIPNEKGLPIINHKDENPQNNCVTNLEWCTYKYNQNYGHCKEKRRKALEGFRRSEKIKEVARKNGKAASKPVTQLTRGGSLLAHFASAKDASIITGVNHSHIIEVCMRKRKSAGGYLWAYGKEC